MDKKLATAERERLVQAARRAMEHAYAPYSQFKVGAALLTMGGELFSGCNVENTSYGLTSCAERTAIFTAVAERGPKVVIRALAVVNNKGLPCSPCGACRQVIFEFGPQATVLFQASKGWKSCSIQDLLPEGFYFQ